MAESLTVLLATAAGLGFLHTLLGPDHYLPFVAMARAGGWSRAKLMSVTFACGLGHVVSSMALGVAGIGAGLTFASLGAVESFRGALAAWGLLAFGLIYSLWGLRRAARKRPHTHWHAHADGTTHAHTHVHDQEHGHLHAETQAQAGKAVGMMTPWVLFTLFVFGPCEPLIPLMMVPAALGDLLGAVLIAAVFSGTTIVTMLAIVLTCWAGLERLPRGSLERYMHSLAGATLMLCALGILFLGL